jgi:hypothetical protein
VSPTNVSVNQQGVVKLTDLGANSRTDPMLLAAMGLMKGRMSYLAPEVMQQESPDQRADVFSGGVVLWEALTGRRLFKGHSDEEIITTVLTRDVPAPRSVEPAVSQELNDTCLKALKRRPDERFQTAAEFESALLQALAGTTPRTLSQTLGKLVRTFVPVLTQEQVAALPRPEERTTVAEALELGADLLEENTSAKDLGNWSMFNESFERPLMAEEPNSSLLVTEEFQAPLAAQRSPAPPPRARLLSSQPPVEAVPPPAFLREKTPPPLPPVTPEDWDDATPAATVIPPHLLEYTPAPEAPPPVGRGARVTVGASETFPVVAEEPTPQPGGDESPWGDLPNTRAGDPPPGEVGTEILVAPAEAFDETAEHPPVVVVMSEPLPQESQGWLGGEEVAAHHESLDEVTGTEIPMVVDPNVGWGNEEATQPPELPELTMPPAPEVNPHFLMPEDMDPMPLPQPMFEAPVMPPMMMSLDPEPEPVVVVPPVLQPMVAPPRGPLPQPRATQFTASAMAMANLAHAPFTLEVPGQPPSPLNARDAFALLSNPQAPRGYSMSMAGQVQRSSSELGQLLVMDHLALFPGLGDPPRHQGTTHTGRMGHLLMAYEQQRATGVFSLQSAQGHYAAFFIVQGNVHYICMTGTGAVLMDSLIDRVSIDMKQLEALLRLVMMEAEPLYNALLRIGLTQDEPMYQSYCAFLIKRAEQLPYWGQCTFEYRPDVILPYQLPVPAIPVSSMASTAG